MRARFQLLAQALAAFDQGIRVNPLCRYGLQRVMHVVMIDQPHRQQLGDQVGAEPLPPGGDHRRAGFDRLVAVETDLGVEDAVIRERLFNGRAANFNVVVSHQRARRC